MKKLIRKYITQMLRLQTFVHSFFVFLLFILQLQRFSHSSLPLKVQ